MRRKLCLFWKIKVTNGFVEDIGILSSEIIASFFKV